MAKNKDLIKKGKLLAGKEYFIKEACWQGDGWSSEGGEFTDKGVIRFQGTFMEVLDTWDEIDDDILEECINAVDEDEE